MNYDFMKVFVLFNFFLYWLLKTQFINNKIFAVIAEKIGLLRNISIKMNKNNILYFITSNEK